MSAATRLLRKLSAIIVLAVLAVAGTAQWPEQAVAGGNGGGKRAPHARGRILVQFHRGVTSWEAETALAMVGAKAKQKLARTGVQVVELSEDVDENEALEDLASSPEVAFAEFDVILPPAETVPDDPSYSSQWHLPAISGPSAWSASTGSSNIVIAICDTGVDGTHADLAAKMVSGWNVYDNNSNTSDVYGHGTAVAGTAAAIGNNGVGIASVAWNCLIMPIRVSDANGYATYSAIASAITYAADHGARVANVSYKASGSLTVQNAAKYFMDKGGVVTISAGNDGVFDSTADNPYVLTVSATDSSDTITSWSTTGNAVDVSAPGSGIYTTVRGGGYGYYSGTSFSAPVTAGVAALVLSANPSLSGSQAADVVRASADDLGTSGYDTTYGYGRVNASAAVALAASSSSSPSDTTAPVVKFLAPSSGASVGGTVTVDMDATDNSSVASVSLTANGIPVGTETSAPWSFAWDTTSYAEGSCVLAATATDAAGNAKKAEITVTVSNTQDTTAPTVTILSPSSGATTTKNLSISATAADDIAVTRMQVYVDGKLLATALASSIKTTWSIRKATKGAHVLLVKASDAAGNTGSVETTFYVSTASSK